MIPAVRKMPALFMGEDGGGMMEKSSGSHEMLQNSGSVPMAIHKRPPHTLPRTGGEAK